METNQGHNYADFVMDAMQQDHVLFAQSPALLGHQDWRDVAVKHALIQSYNANWIWFTEQDFLPVGEDIFEDLEAVDVTGREWAAAFQGPRMHPCCLFLKRSLLNRLNLDFAAKPPDYDHFGAIQKQLEGISGAVVDADKYTHMNGLSHNCSLLASGEQPNYEPDKFKEYVANCLKVSVPIDLRMRALFNSYLAK